MKVINPCCLLAAALCVASSSSVYAQAHVVAEATGTSAVAAKALLISGNARYVSGTSKRDHQTAARRTELAGSQTPFAAILSCADSRVPPELVFDQGLGDLFVTRVAGNVVNDQEIGSLEYAVQHLTTKLIVVMGHVSCGAVKAAVQYDDKYDQYYKAFADPIKPSVQAADKGRDEKLFSATVDQNVRNQVAKLKAVSTLHDVMIVGAVYDLATGKVKFLD